MNGVRTLSDRLGKLVTRLRDDLNDADFVLLYAYNRTGKTRLSMSFKDAGKRKNKKNPTGTPDTLYFNAFTEDLFVWENDLDGDSVRRLQLNEKSSFFNATDGTRCWKRRIDLLPLPIRRLRFRLHLQSGSAGKRDRFQARFRELPKGRRDQHQGVARRAEHLHLVRLHGDLRTYAGWASVLSGEEVPLCRRPDLVAR